MSEEPIGNQNTALPTIPSDRIEILSPRQFLQLIGTVSSSTDLDMALRNLCDSLAMIYNDDQVSIYHIDSDDQPRFFFSSGKSFSRPTDQPNVLVEGVLINSLKHSRSILIEDFGQVKEFLPPHQGVNSELVVPIIFQSKHIALIDILDQKVLGLNQSDQTTMEALAASLSGIFFNLQTMNLLRLKADREELINKIVKDLSHETSVEGLLTFASQELSKIPVVSQVSIHLSIPEKMENN